MKIRIVIGLLISLLSVNMIGCGCGTPHEAEATEPASVVETESEIVETTDVYTEIDYAEDLIEVEGGDGEEITEESTEESTEVEEEANDLGYVLTECDPVTKYTNTNANVRATPDKAGDLITTAQINTEFTVTATTDTGWSRVESNGVVCFIKSSLLSDTKTEIPSDSGNNGGNQSQPTPSSSSGNPDLGGRENRSGRGTGNYDGGTTGTDSSDDNFGGGY